MKGCPALLLALTMAFACRPINIAAADADDTLRSCVNSAELVVLGKFTGIGIPTTSSGWVLHFSKFEVREVFKGDPSLKGTTIKTTASYATSDKKDGQHPLINDDGERVLFLKSQPNNAAANWVTTDRWFGVQPVLPALEEALESLAEEAWPFK
ncbi:MAG: hypothetical protein ACAI34_04515 [Verrucomicrobium sp.]